MVIRSWSFSQALISLLSTTYYIATGTTKASRGCTTTATKLLFINCVVKRTINKTPRLQLFLETLKRFLSSIRIIFYIGFNS